MKSPRGKCLWVWSSLSSSSRDNFLINFLSRFDFLSFFFFLFIFFVEIIFDRLVNFARCKAATSSNRCLSMTYSQLSPKTWCLKVQFWLSSAACMMTKTRTMTMTAASPTMMACNSAKLNINLNHLCLLSSTFVGSSQFSMISAYVFISFLVQEPLWGSFLCYRKRQNHDS